MKRSLPFILLCLLGLVSQCNAQDTTLNPSPCEIDTLKVVSAYLAKNNYYLSEIVIDRGKKVRIRQDHIYLGGGYGHNTIKAPEGKFVPMNRQIYYFRGSASFDRVNFGLNIGNSIVSADLSYILK